MAILASSVSSSPLSDFQVLFAQFTRQTHCLLFARADVCLIRPFCFLPETEESHAAHCIFFSVYNTSPPPAKVQKRGRTMVALKIIYSAHEK